MKLISFNKKNDRLDKIINNNCEEDIYTDIGRDIESYVNKDIHSNMSKKYQLTEFFSIIEDIISNNKDIVINDLVYNQDNVVMILNYLQELGIENINDILVEKIDFFFRDIDEVKEHFNRYDKDVIVKLINEDISNLDMV